MISSGLVCFQRDKQVELQNNSIYGGVLPSCALRALLRFLNVNRIEKSQATGASLLPLCI